MLETPHVKPQSKQARVVCTVVVQDQFEGAAARGQECNGGEFMSECELTNCVWGKRACQGAGREFLHLTVIGPDPWDAHALFIRTLRSPPWRCAHRSAIAIPDA